MCRQKLKFREEWLRDEQRVRLVIRVAGSGQVFTALWHVTRAKRRRRETPELARNFSGATARNSRLSQLWLSFS